MWGKQIKIVQKQAEVLKIAQKNWKQLLKCEFKNQKIAFCEKISTSGAIAATEFFHIWPLSG